MSQPKSICLCMIVRNESAVIARALRSVREIVDYWVICDTGSTDSTPTIILQTMSGVPGELHRVAWRNFGHNRTRAIQLARGKADYILILDADMVAHVRRPFKEKLTADYYEIRYEGHLDYAQPMLVADRHEWVYVGVTHEHIDAPTALSRGRLDELTLLHLGDGGMRGDKFERDVRLLTAALVDDPSNARNMFYLAQSYKDMDEYAAALLWYERRLAQGGGWDEERWYAMYQAARMKQELGRGWDEVLADYLKAYAFRPTRLEPLYQIVKHYREAQEYQLGYLYAARTGHPIPYPPDTLFIERPVYEYLLPLEYGVCAYGAGRISEAVATFNQVLRCDGLPDWVADSAVRGRKMALDILYDGDVPIAAQAPNRMVVLTPFHNPGGFLERCVESLLAQDHPNFEILFVDDASTDGSHHFVPASDKRVRLFRNRERMGGAYNLHRMISRQCQSHDIVVCVDGDDWLACADALTHIDRFYQEHDCWVMYGQFQFADGGYGLSQPFASPSDFLQLRSRWQTSHIRTFRAGLFHAIADQDPAYECLKDEQGEWLTSAVDAALMFPLLELAGFDRVRYNDRILYIYNDQSPLNVHKVEGGRQRDNFKLVERKRPFARINHYGSSAADPLDEDGDAQPLQLVSS
jgi:glycosyltransferase involved in cell wall biosynthesis